MSASEWNSDASSLSDYDYRAVFKLEIRRESGRPNSPAAIRSSVLEAADQLSTNPA